MTHQEIISLFGYSEYSPEIKQLFDSLHIPFQQSEMLISWRRYESETWDVELVFRAKNNFCFDYGDIKKAYTESYEEAFLEEINFGSHKGNINYPFSLPYNMVFSDEPEIVKNKISMKSSESSDASWGSYLQFNTEELQILTGFGNQKNLIWVRIRPLELAFKKKRELTKTLRQQNKNITAENTGQLVQLKNQSPIVAWRRRMDEGDNAFNEKCFSETGKILNTFIDTLVVAAEQKKANVIYSSIKKVIQSINKLNDKQHGFVETLEREELVDYIHNAVRLTGFKIDNGLDLTEEWREW